MQQLELECRRAALRRSPVHISGPVGSGKEKIAEYIAKLAIAHKYSKLFARRNTQSFNPELITSDLFGHKKGSFTGAIENRKGLLETCMDEGVLFLDEVGELNSQVQALLLSVLERPNQFVPVGDNEPKTFNGRILTASNADLDLRVQQGLMRADFRSRIIKGGILTVPSLAERSLETKRALIKHFEKVFLQRDEGGSRFTDEAIHTLSEYVFQDNVRGLESFAEQAFFNAMEDESSVVTIDHLPPKPSIKMEMVAPQSEQKVVIAPSTHLESLTEFNEDNVVVIARSFAAMYTTAGESMSTKYFSDVMAISGFMLNQDRFNQTKLATDLKTTRGLIRSRLRGMAEVTGSKSLDELYMQLKTNPVPVLLKFVQAFSSGEFTGEVFSAKF